MAGQSRGRIISTYKSMSKEVHVSCRLKQTFSTIAVIPEITNMTSMKIVQFLRLLTSCP